MCDLCLCDPVAIASLMNLIAQLKNVSGGVKIDQAAGSAVWYIVEL
jgi:hypothetical protein